MKRLTIVLAAGALLFAFHPAARAQETAAPAGSPAADELRTLQKLLEHQGKQLDALSEQVTKLTQRLDAREGHEPHDAPTTPPAETPTEPAASAPAPGPAAAPATPPAPEVPRAEATGGGVKHLVAKGETLTSIAKHYNIPLADLQKANKSVNDRKLQIGQVLNIPSSATPEPASPEKKETP